MAARHAVLADLAQSARPGTPAETASAFSHGELLPAVGSSGCCRRDEQPVLDPLMQARALVSSVLFQEASATPAAASKGSYCMSAIKIDRPGCVPRIKAAKHLCSCPNLWSDQHTLTLRLQSSPSFMSDLRYVRGNST